MLHRHHKIPKHMGAVKASKEKEDGLPTPRK
jgi:hypothetical protein